MSSLVDSGFSRSDRPAHAQPLTTASSSVTLVEHFRAGMSSIPNPVPPMPTLSQSTDASATAWGQRLSASFGAIAEQINAASQALAAVELTAGNSGGAAANGDFTSVVAHLIARLDAIEDTQAHMGREMANLVARTERHDPHPPAVNRRVESGVEEEPRGTGDPAVQEEDNSLARTVEELQKKVDALVEAVRLDQVRLYNRLQNATISNQKMTVKPLVMANGKTPANFPGTKGEFEHMTKERYEHLLKSYNQPIKGDTPAKREAVREFLGLSQAQ